MEKTDYEIVPMRAYRGNFRPYYEQYKGSTNQKTGDSMVSPEKKLKKFLLILGITGAVYGAFRYLLPLVVPFLCAYGTALFLRPSVRFLSNRIAVPFRGEMHHLPVSLVGGIELLVMSCLVFGLLYAGGSMAVSQTGLFIRRFPDWLSALDLRLTDTCRLLEQKMGLKADALVELAGRAVEEVRQMFKNSTMPVLMDRSVSALRVAVAGIVLFFIYFVAVLLGKAEQVRIPAGISRSGRADRIRGERVAEDPGVYSVPNKCRVYLRTGSDRKSLFVFVWLRDRDPGRTAGIGGRDCADSVGSRAAVSEGVEKSCGDLRHLCGLLLSASDLRGETDGEAGGAFSAGIAGIHVCGT